jgi:hypothetical protein
MVSGIKLLLFKKSNPSLLSGSKKNVFSVSNFKCVPITESCFSAK